MGAAEWNAGSSGTEWNSGEHTVRSGNWSTVVVLTVSAGLVVFSVYSVQESTTPVFTLLAVVLVGPVMESGYECMELLGPFME